MTEVERQDPLTFKIIGAAMEVHRELGPGLLESLYESALCIELENRGIPYERQKPLLVNYKGCDIGNLKADILVDGQVIVELKAAKELTDVDTAQILSYLKATKMRRGLLINFNVKMLKNGIKRFVI